MRKRILFILLFAAVLAGAFAILRYQVVEPEGIAAWCSSERTEPLLCRLRATAIQGFARHLYGPIAMALAILGWIGGSRYLAMLAMVVGMAGAMLYDFEFAGAGLLLGAMLLAYGLSDRDNRQFDDAIASPGINPTISPAQQPQPPSTREQA